MLSSFNGAFRVVDAEFPDQPTLSLTSEKPGSASVLLRTTWRRGVQSFRFDLQVPEVIPIRYSWDQGVYGTTVQFPRGATRFCMPLLVSPQAQQIAAARPADRRALFQYAAPWEFRWQSFYDRLNAALIGCISEKIEMTERQLTIPYLRSQLQRAIQQLVNGAADPQRRVPGNSRQENGRSKTNSLPLTDEALLIRQMYEVELGYPDIINDDRLYSQIKQEFLRFVDPAADLTWTSKSKTGRFVMRTRPGDPASHATGRPMSQMALMFDPLHGVSDPKRTARENRSACHGLRLVRPIAPPLQSTAVPAIPAPYQERITTLNIAFFDAPGLNAWAADEATAARFPNTVVGEKLGLDGILLTPSGQEKLRAYTTQSEILEDDEYLALRDELKEEPGFREEELANLAEVLTDGTPVFTRSWRYWYDTPIDARYGKYKLTVGGVKGVGRPIEQLWTRRRKGDPLEPIDAVVSLRTVLSKGAADAMLYALLAVAGTHAIDPVWTRDQIGERIKEGLKRQGLRADGCTDIVRQGTASMYGLATLQEEEAEIFRAMGVTLLERPRHETLGRAIAGPCPVVVAPEHERRQASVSQGVALSVHSRLLQSIPYRPNPRAEREITELGAFWEAAGAIAVPCGTERITG